MQVLNDNLLTAVLFADQQTILTASRYSIWKLLHQLPDISPAYNIENFTIIAKILGLKEK
jgi:hypothetical protein